MMEYSPMRIKSRKFKDISLVYYCFFDLSLTWMHGYIPATAFANSLDPDQACQNVGPDLDKLFYTLVISLKEYLENVDFLDEKKA